ncbi:MAG: hypothetical protein FJ386_08930 [Verrucomicrobia bacterium]|nr:hypothetical protein [Verrucomicrobiota bacterium]
MTPNRILPDLQCSLLCEDIRQEANGNFIVLGILSVIRLPQVPVTAGRLCVFNRWCAGLGQFSEVVRVMAPDQLTVLRQSQMKFALNDPGMNTTNATVFGGLEFKTDGVYWVEVLVDDVMKLRFPLPVIVVPPPPAGQPGPPAAGPAA